jgi:hypothetical protein
MNPPRPKQSLSQELLDDLLRFVRQKFYAESGDDAKCFAQDRARLLKWAILWPASWLNNRGLTLPGDRYKQILTTILLEAVRHGNTTKVNYRPAWLKAVIQRHFAIHGEEYLAEAKSARTMAEHILLTTGKLKVTPGPDPVRELAAAASLLRTKRPVQTAVKAAKKDQLTLL